MDFGSTIASEGLDNSLSSILTSLDEEELQPDDKLKLLEEVLEYFQSRQYEYSNDVEFEDDASMLADYKLSRSILLDSLDKCKIMIDITMNMLAAQPQNIMLFEVLQENLKLSQTSAKQLIDLHKSYSSNRRGVLGNKKMVDDMGDDGDKETEALLEKAGVLFK